MRFGIGENKDPVSRRITTLPPRPQPCLVEKCDSTFVRLLQDLANRNALGQWTGALIFNDVMILILI